MRGISGSTENQLFIRNLLSLARAFNLVTVAECVETAEEAEILKREGVNLLQGYYFGRPTVDAEWRREVPIAQGRKPRAKRIGPERRRALPS